MKCRMILLIICLMALSNLIANASSIKHDPRGYYQMIISPKVNILESVTNTGMTHNENYLVTVTCSSSPGQVITTAQPGGATPYALRINVLRKGQLASAFLYVQLASFENQVNPGDEIHCTVTYIGKGPYYNQSTSWSYFIPEGTAAIFVSDKSEAQIVPPLNKAKGKLPLNK